MSIEAFEALARDNPQGLVRMKIVESFAPYHANALAGFPPDEAHRLYTRKAAVPADEDGDEIPLVIAATAAERLPRAAESVEIPDGWETSHHLSRLALAKQIAGKVAKSVDEADEIIRAEVERRKESADVADEV